MSSSNFLNGNHLFFGPRGRWTLYLKIVFVSIPLLALGTPSSFSGDTRAPITGPLAADYQLHHDGSVSLRICFNWSCASDKGLTFSQADMAGVISYMAQCGGTSLYERLQRLRVGIWQMQLIAQKYLPELANDRELNEFDGDLQGRLDCVDSSSNTTTYLWILQDLAQLPGWSVTAPEVRNLFDLNGVHWTAVVMDRASGESWSVDSWFRPHGHLPFVMPLADWQKDKRAWDPPYNAQNPYPLSMRELCPTVRETVDP